MIGRSHDPSFPSDHAAGGFALALGVWAYDGAIGTVLSVLAAILSLRACTWGRTIRATFVAGELIAGAVVGALYLARPARQFLEAIARRCGGVLDAAARRSGMPGLSPR